VTGVNLLGAAYGIQAFVPRMLTQGRPAALRGVVPGRLDQAVTEADVGSSSCSRATRRR
jgi:hypothetical protein